MTNGKIKFADEIIGESGCGASLPIVSTETTEERIETIRKRKTFLDAEAIREIIRQELERFESRQIVRVIKIKKNSYQKCKTKIIELVHKRKGGITTLEISETLNIEPEIVLKILMELKEEGKIDKIDKGN